MIGYAGRAGIKLAESWPRTGGVAPRAISIHMAEGGGTVSWLTRVDGNSSHYVVEYDGQVWQMVDETRAAGSMNPNLTRKDNDPPYTFLGESIRYGRAALDFVGISADPNRYAIAIEIEGFAVAGPNAKQRLSLVKLIADIRRRRGPLPCVGHRDQQAYKRCPGHKIPWADYGGHAKKTLVTKVTGLETPPVAATKGSSVPELPTLVTLRPDAVGSTRSRWLYVWSDHRADPGNRQLQPIRPLLLTRFVDADTYAVAYEPSADDANAVSTEMFVKTADVLKTTPFAIEDTTPFDQAYVNDAVATATAGQAAEVSHLRATVDAVKAAVAE
jgi:hypothetical protein